MKKTSSLRSRFLLITASVFLVLGMGALSIFQQIAEPIAFNLGARFAEKQVLYDQAKVDGQLSRELALARKLADSELLRLWAQNEKNPNLRREALKELESYRKLFHDHSYFFVIRSSLSYYFNDSENSHAGKELAFVLNPNDPKDAWFNAALKIPTPYQINPDYDYTLKAFKVWFNVLVYDDRHQVIGIAGSGIDISDFIRDFLSTDDAGLTRILVDKNGAIQAHPRLELIDQNTQAKTTQAHSTVFNLLQNQAERQKLSDTFAKLKSGQEAVMTLPLTLEGHPSLVGVAQLKELGWFVITVMDTENLVPHKAFLPLASLLIASLLLMIGLIFMLLNRLIISRIERMDRATREVAKGNYEINLPVIAEDEIGRLSNEFNRMAAALREYTGKLEFKVAERTAELAESNQRLSMLNEKVQESIRYASLIQSSLLPSAESIEQSVGELATLWRPRDTVGGDFFLAESVGEHCCIALLDCTGHGVPGAMMTMIADSVVRRALSEQGLSDPQKLAFTLDQLLREALNRPDATDHFDHGMDMGLMILNPSERKLLFIGAGIDLYHLHETKLKRFNGGRKGLGYARRRPQSFNITTFNPAQNDRLFMSSDGLYDQSGGETGYGFGRSRFEAHLIATAALPVKEQMRSLEKNLLAYQQDHLQRDDISVIALEIA